MEIEDLKFVSEEVAEIIRGIGFCTVVVRDPINPDIRTERAFRSTGKDALNQSLKKARAYLEKFKCPNLSSI